MDDAITAGSAQPDADAPLAGASVARDGETLRESDWRAELLQTGIRGRAGQRLTFTRLEPLPGARWLHADGESVPAAASPERPEQDEPSSDDTGPERVVVSFGPDHAPLEQRHVDRAIEEARKLAPRPTVIVFAAFQFDPEAAKDIDETRWPGVMLLKAQMNADLLADDLKKTRASNESFWLVGQPDVEAVPVDDGPDPGKVLVTVHGFDYYDTRSGTVDSGGAEKIALWMLDPTTTAGASSRAAGVLPPGRREGRLGEAGEGAEDGDRSGVDRAVPRHGFVAVRSRPAPPGGGEDRGRPGHREPQGAGPAMTGRRTIDQLIINSPYDVPAEHWRYNRGERPGEAGTFTRETGRRPAGYHVPVASDARRDPYDPGEFVELPLVNRIRTRVDEWRAAGYPGATGITRRLLDHWRRETGPSATSG